MKKSNACTAIPTKFELLVTKTSFELAILINNMKSLIKTKNLFCQMHMSFYQCRQLPV